MNNLFLTNVKILFSQRFSSVYTTVTMACIVESQRGKPLFVLDNFKYSKVTRPLASGEIKWRCIKRNCTAFLKTFGISNNITEKNDDHKHEPVKDQVLQQQCVTAVAKRKATEDICARPNQIFRSAVNNVPGAQDLQVSDIRYVKRNMYNARRKLMPALPKPIEEVHKVLERKMVLVLEQPAPKFKGTAVVNGEFKDISLESFKGKYVVLFFYPLDFTFVCPTEIIAFSDRANEFAAINCQLIAASCDSHFSHLAWVNTARNEGGLGKMQIPLLADKSASIAKDYQVYNEATGIPYRGLFIIDDKGNLRQITINDLPVGRSVDETLRLVQAFQYTDEHGEVCPANWKPGSKTINPSKSKDYFKTVE